MVTPPNFARPEPGLARQVRDRFVRAVDAMVEPLGAAIDAQLDGALRGNTRMSMAELSTAMEAGGAFKRVRAAWVDGARRQWAAAVKASQDPAARPAARQSLDFDLVDDDVPF